MARHQRLLPRPMATAFLAGASMFSALPGATAQPAPDQTGAIVAAANAFLSTLDASQRDAGMFAFDDAAQRANWSNFPNGVFPRAGVEWGELDEAQHAALLALLEAVLSPYGVQMVREQMAADDVLAGLPTTDVFPAEVAIAADAEATAAAAAAANPASTAGGAPPGGGRAGGPPAGGGGGTLFGSDLYFVSFLGEPSETDPWMLQFGGHHLALNITVVGPDVTFAPSLTGGQPTMYLVDGQPVYVAEEEAEQAAALMASLTDAQRAEVVRGAQSINLVLGPGQDGKVLAPEGLPARAMDAAQKDRLLALIAARIGILNDEDFAAAMADIEANIDETYFAWFGSPDDAVNSYWRVTGPALLLEFSPQGSDGGNHLHNMYRNPTNDYGADWAQ